MEFLALPDSVVDMLMPPTISSDEVKTIVKSKCDRRFIAKKYKSITELRKDDNTDNVFYDKEYDDTPYHLLDKYLLQLFYKLEIALARKFVKYSYKNQYFGCSNRVDVG